VEEPKLANFLTVISMAERERERKMANMLASKGFEKQFRLEKWQGKCLRLSDSWDKGALLLFRLGDKDIIVTRIIIY
jgi:hypothetical protein